MIDQALKSADVGPVNLTFPDHSRDVKIKTLNGDHARGRSMVHIRREPHAFIATHLHKKGTEVLRILDGDFINENRTVTRRFSSTQGGQL